MWVIVGFGFPYWNLCNKKETIIFVANFWWKPQKFGLWLANTRFDSWKYCNLGYNSFNWCFVANGNKTYFGALVGKIWNPCHTLEFRLEVSTLVVKDWAFVTPWIGILVDKNWNACHSWDSCGQNLRCLSHIGTFRLPMSQSVPSVPTWA